MFSYIGELFSWVGELFSKIELLDKILLIILLLSLIAKLITEFICWIICKNYNVDKTHEKKCIYLSTGRAHDCNLPAFKRKYFKNEYCNKNKCPGYRTSRFSLDEIKVTYKFPFIILTLSKWMADLSSILLIVRTLFHSTLS